MVKALLSFLVNGINKHFLDFSKGSLLQTPLKISAIRQQRGLCLPDSWKTQNTEMLFVPQAVLNIVTRFHSLAWCFYWLVRDKTIIFRVLLFCAFKLLRVGKRNAVWAFYLPSCCLCMQPVNSPESQLIAIVTEVSETAGQDYRRHRMCLMNRCLLVWS